MSVDQCGAHSPCDTAHLRPCQRPKGHNDRFGPNYEHEHVDAHWRHTWVVFLTNMRGGPGRPVGRLL